MMAIDAPVRNPWTIAPHVNDAADRNSAPAAAHPGHAVPSGSTCPVCRRAHPGRLVRRLAIGVPMPPAPKATPAAPSPAPYYPPAVPVLSTGSRGPIGRTARWSIALA